MHLASATVDASATHLAYPCGDPYGRALRKEARGACSVKHGMHSSVGAPATRLPYGGGMRS
jgi:hypothetical protein